MPLKMVKVLRITLLIGFVVGLSQIGLAEENAVTLDQVVVTATKQERSVKDTPSTITVITAEDIEESGAQTVPQALKNIPGVVIEERYGLNAEVSLRGNAYGKYGYTLVLVDGMPIVSSDTGRVYWEMIPLSNVEQIEVVMGPGSALWGGNAFGGTVNIITKKPGTEPSVGLSTKFGEYGMRHYSLYGSIAGKEGWQKDLSFQVSAEKKEADGWRENSSYDNDNYWLKVGKIFEAPDAAIDLTLSSSTRDQGVPSNITQEMWDNDDLTTAASGSAKYSNHDCDVDYQRLTFEKGLGANSRIKANLYNRHKEYDYLYTSFTTVDNTTTGGGLQYEIEAGRHSLVLGVDAEVSDLEKKAVKTTADHQPDWSNLKSKSDIQTDINKYAVFVQDSWKIFEKFKAIIGVRWDKAEFDNTGYQYNSAGTVKTDVTGSSSVDGFSPQANLLYKLNENVNLYTAVGRAFKIPTPSQLYTSTDYANPDLDAEKSMTYEVGTKYSFKDISGSLALYLSEVTDLVAKNETEELYVNIGEAEHKGIEASVTYRIMDGLVANLGADYTRTKIKQNPSDTTIEGKYLSQVPEYKISFGIDYDHPLGFFTSINGRKLGPWYMDDENEREYNGYFLADCKVGYKTNIKKSKIYWSLGCNNIFDKKYAASCYTSGTSNKYYPGMPRYFYTEIKIEF